MQNGNSQPRSLDIAVIVPTFNSADHIRSCISSIHRCLPAAEVIVVDNGSTDTTCEVLRESFSGVTIVSGHGNVGFGRACNIGARNASSRYLLYLNPDAELVKVDEGALAELAQAESFGIVAAELIGQDGSRRPTVRRRYRHWMTEFLAVHLLAMLSPYAPRPRYVDEAGLEGMYSVDGAVFVVRTSEFRTIGGFDDRFFMYSEDVDLAHRYRERGLRLRATPAVLARHVGSTSAPTPMLLALSFLGWLEYTHKWHGRAAAATAAVMALAAYSTVLLLLRVAAKLTGSQRFAAKAQQVEQILSYIASEGFDRAAEGRAGSPGDIEVKTHHRSLRYLRAGQLAGVVFGLYARRLQLVR